jgi:hypothetical protein
MTKMKEITITTATIDFGDWKISATGRLEEFCDWDVGTSYNNIFAPTRNWTEHEYFSSEEDLEEYLWSEVQRLNQKYSSCVFSHELEEVEDEDSED